MTNTLSKPMVTRAVRDAFLSTQVATKTIDDNKMVRLLLVLVRPQAPEKGCQAFGRTWVSHAVQYGTNKDEKAA